MKDNIFQNAKAEIKKLGDIDYIYWIDGKYRFIEFEIEGKGVGLYSVPLNRLIIQPGRNSEISVDDPMGLIYYRMNESSSFVKINFDGEEVLV